jgi:hypothetical protein
MIFRKLLKIRIYGWDGLVRGKIAKGQFVKGMQHPRIFGRGHIGQGQTNIAPNASRIVKGGSKPRIFCRPWHD